MQAKDRDPKAAAIIEAAFRTFFQYGVKRATMDDIARAAGMSRPALYLVYKNKADIFRACVLSMTEDLREKLAAITDATGDAEERIMAVARTGIVEPHETIGASAHAEELFALKSEIGADLFRDWMKLIETAITQILEQEEAAGRVTLEAAGVSAAEIAGLITDGAEGFKLRMTSAEELARRLEAFIRLMIGPLAVPTA
ncbi:TetR/AcrR family transcriptional regulator [Rhizobium sp. C4]|uniref:TetR/AcrR family transcriptional regulator n=1 Tax=Rhizobium sp. C4 TaxID=1349800 RepID=UPI001E4FD212|nr:TetR/AcrR family transcriptional regulator [Rhizobium sp. C4]MCD2174737.1 TetR/AcrR family transcriptional regulator [Rhizobium sp. C4]